MRNFWRRRGLRFPSLLELCTLAAVLLVGRAGAEEGYLQLRGALGVPSAFSRGGNRSKRSPGWRSLRRSTCW